MDDFRYKPEIWMHRVRLWQAQVKVHAARLEDSRQWLEDQRLSIAKPEFDLLMQRLRQPPAKT
jgi:hypothetical protein